MKGIISAAGSVITAIAILVIEIMKANSEG